MTVLRHYTILRLLGAGGMGAVYEALDTQRNCKVAIKILLPQYAKNAELIGRLFNEARTVNHIKHSSIVRIFDSGQIEDGTAYIVMEFLAGVALSKLLERSGGYLSVPAAIRITCRATDALAAAHRAGIIHRDLKPDNIMILDDAPEPVAGSVKLLDFGIAKVTQDSNLTQLKKTATDMVMGTPYYMSPEQCRGAGHVDEKTDVYSLGVVLYEMIAGRTPFDSKGSGELMGMHLFKQPPPIQRFRANLPPEISTLVHSLLKKEPQERPSMVELLGQLTRILHAIETNGISIAEVAPPVRDTDSLPLSDEVRSSTLGQLAGQSRLERPQQHRQYLRRAGGATLAVFVAGIGLILLWKRGPEAQLTITPVVEKQKGAPQIVPEPIRTIRWSIKTTPAGAEVVDESHTLLGLTPWIREQRAGSGRVRITLSRPGYAETSVSLDREVSSETERSLVLLQPKSEKPRSAPLSKPAAPPKKKTPDHDGVKFEFEP